MTEPFFIVGFQRSGTTLLRLMLDSHPEVAVPLDTTGLWSRYEARLADYGDLQHDRDVRRLVEDLLAEERIRLWEATLEAGSILARRQRPGYPGIIEAFHLAYAATRGKQRWGDKDPGNMERLDQLHRWFPACKIIHIIRDGRDACLSQGKQDFGIQHLLDCACAWREQVEWVRRIGVILGSRYIEVRYEDLVAAPEAELRRICAFLDLPYDPAMLEYHRHVGQSVPSSKRHLWPLLEKPPQRDNALRWKTEMTTAQRICFEKRAWGVLRAIGYEVLPAKPGGAYLEELWQAAKGVAATVHHRLRDGH